MSAEAFASLAARYCTNFRTVSGVLGPGQDPQYTDLNLTGAYRIALSVEGDSSCALAPAPMSLSLTGNQLSQSARLRVVRRHGGQQRFLSIVGHCGQ